MESCCRVCSRSDEFRRFSLYAVAEVSQEVIANMIRDTSDTQVSSEDGLPQHICPDCLMTLSLAYSFRKQCRRSDAKFREYWGGRTPSQSIDQQQQQQQLPRRSQSQAPDDSSFTAIKEEVDIYDYEYSVPSHHDQQQWVIQNPRTIGEGAMTVVHNSGQYYEDAAAAAAAVAGPAHDGAADRDGSSAMPMVTTHLGGGSHHDASEMGESSGLAQKGEKLKKKAPTPERYSQRIRRQMDTDDVISIPDSPTRYEAYRRAPPKFVYAKPRVVPVAPFCIGGEKSKELLESMLANQNKMLENQRKMMHMIVETISNVNYISEKVRGTTAAAEASPSSAATATAPPAAAPTYYSTNFMDPVNSVETLKALEESLQDDSVMQKYVSSMTFICGNNGKANGIDCCYKLVDYFITRQFLLQCSWTGNSRILGPGKSPGDAASDLPQDGESGKVALKFYRKFRTLFLNLIMLADSSFTEMQCEMFFKRIMKNSKQRVMCKMITSKHRNRPSNLKYKIQRPSTSSEPSIEMAAENNEQPFSGEVAASHSEAASAVEFPQHPYVGSLSMFHENM